MNGEKNLRTPTSEEARINGAKGGRASVAARRQKKLLRECIEELLEREYDTPQGKMLGAEALAVRLMKKALDGDIKAFAVLRDTAGQKPVEHVEVSRAKGEMANEIDQAMSDLRGGGADGGETKSGPPTTS